MPPLLGIYDFTDRLAFAAADWCFRLHCWPIMLPLLGVYDFTDRLAFAATYWCFRLHCWPIMLPLLGVYDFTDRLAFAAADWYPRLYSWLVTPRSRASTSSPTDWPSPPPTGVSVCIAGLLCRRCWASTTSPPAGLRRRRLVSSPIQLVGHTTVHGRPRLHRPASLRRCRLVFLPALLAYYAAVDGRLHFHRQLPQAASMAGVFIAIDGRLYSHIGHLGRHQGKDQKAKS
uniref:cysteine dioxygenase n=1 Tax=Oryza sativa subsp. japonica TaxID=39947 RepID=Q6MWG8_ORYSJ|nr:B1160F02.8 [Oryza sativa Japonica Group]